MSLSITSESLAKSKPNPETSDASLPSPDGFAQCILHALQPNAKLPRGSASPCHGSQHPDEIAEAHEATQDSPHSQTAENDPALTLQLTSMPLPNPQALPHMQTPATGKPVPACGSNCVHEISSSVQGGNSSGEGSPALSDGARHLEPTSIMRAISISPASTAAHASHKLSPHPENPGSNPQPVQHAPILAATPPASGKILPHPAAPQAISPHALGETPQSQAPPHPQIKSQTPSNSPVPAPIVPGLTSTNPLLRSEPAENRSHLPITTPDATNPRPAKTDGMSVALPSTLMPTTEKMNQSAALKQSASPNLPGQPTHSLFTAKTLTEPPAPAHLDHIFLSSQPHDASKWMNFETEAVEKLQQVYNGQERSLQTVEKLLPLLSREIAQVKQFGADSLTVVLKPDESTELFLHLARKNGHTEAFLRLDKGNFDQLNSNWPQLEQALAQQNVRLAPLKEPLIPQLIPSDQHVSMNHQDRPRQNTQNNNHQSEELAPANGHKIDSVPPKKATTSTLKSSRNGWESWA